MVLVPEFNEKSRKELSLFGRKIGQGDTRVKPHVKRVWSFDKFYFSERLELLERLEPFR